MDLLKEFLRKTGIGLKEFIKANLISSFIGFIISLIGLGYGGVPYYGLIAFALAILDLIPVLGSGLVLIPWAAISLINDNNKLAIILIALFIASFLMEQILEPLILGKSIGLKPLYTLSITIISMIIFSPAIGAIVGSIISIIISVIIDMRKTHKFN